MNVKLILILLILKVFVCIHHSIFGMIYPFDIYKQPMHKLSYIKTCRLTTKKNSFVFTSLPPSPPLPFLLGTALHLLRWPGSVCAPCSYPLAPQDTGAANNITCPFWTNPDPWFLGDVRSCTTLARLHAHDPHALHTCEIQGWGKASPIRLFNRFCWSKAYHFIRESRNWRERHSKGDMISWRTVRES